MPLQPATVPSLYAAPSSPDYPSASLCYTEKLPDRRFEIRLFAQPGHHKPGAINAEFRHFRNSKVHAGGIAGISHGAGDDDVSSSWLCPAWIPARHMMPASVTTEF